MPKSSGRICCQRHKSLYIERTFIHLAYSFFFCQHKNLENLVLLAVKTGTPGFSFGRTEKMGQKSAPHSELVFRDGTVEDKNVCIDPSQASKLKRSHTSTTMQIIDYIFRIQSRSLRVLEPGVARGAYEEALSDSRRKQKVEGKLLVKHEWAQGMLAEMYKNVELGRLSYIESNYANSKTGYSSSLTGSLSII